MTDSEVKLVVGALLHDIGKVIYRTGDGRQHSRSGYDFLVEDVGISDKEILESVLYHHASMLRNAKLPDNSNAYITYIADNIASGTDRREGDAEDYGFEMSMPLEPIFNILNGNSERKCYHPAMMSGESINYPTDDIQKFDKIFYNEVKNQLKDALKGIEWKEHYVNSLLNVLEATTSFLPSSTSKAQVADVSLYDHVKLTAAIGSCIYQYMQEEGVENYREYLYLHAKEFYGERAFLLYSMDISGIQDFIYTIHSEDALKMLRARSFYLEIMMEHLIDTLLQSLSLSRANLLYSGGGHCYMILPNTEAVRSKLDEFTDEINDWLLKTYNISLYLAGGYAQATANNLMNVPEKSYGELFKTMSNIIGEKKSRRYSANQIRYLNSKTPVQYSRECRICKRLSVTDDDDICDVCGALRNSSKAIMREPFFCVVREKEPDAVPLPCDAWLIAGNENEVRCIMEQTPDNLVRVYSKNKYYSGLKVATKIWVGNYSCESAQTTENQANAARVAGAAQRIGVIRADVDNMGQAFTHGFEEKYNTISRTTTLSRQLSLFFKCYINSIMSDKKFSFDGACGKWTATIVYSGGDDLFIVGAWNEIVELAIDIQESFARYTQGTMTLSAGVGMYDAKYPISRIAYETGELEDASKRLPHKNGVTILPDGDYHVSDGDIHISDGTYVWSEFRDKVIAEKYSVIRQYFDNTEDRGSAFLYNLLELIRGRIAKPTRPDDVENNVMIKQINFARYVYLLARLEPDDKAGQGKKDAYREFSKNMFMWINNEDDCRQLKTAITMYVYMNRNKDRGVKEYDAKS